MNEEIRIRPAHLREVTRNILLSAGVDSKQASTVTDNLVWCDMAGRQNHGVERLSILLERVAAGVIRCPCDPFFTRVSRNSEVLHADNGFGHHAGRLAIDRACQLAQANGVGVVGVTDSNFFGAGGYYVARAARSGMISLALSNSYPKVAVPGGTIPVLGTNPFAFGAPRKDGRAIIIDMSTAAVAGSTVREKLARREALDEGIAIDAEGKPINDPARVAEGALLPAAGPKGFGLALLVEILSGVLTGAGMSRQISSVYKDMDRGGRNGHFFLALDTARWMPIDEYFERLEELVSLLGLAGPPGATRIPGDERWSRLADSKKNGIALVAPTFARLESLAMERGVAVPWH